jgi:hypothetical protein
MMKEKMDDLRMPCELYADGKRFGGGTPMATVEFLETHFGITP